MKLTRELADDLQAVMPKLLDMADVPREVCEAVAYGLPKAEDHLRTRLPMSEQMLNQLHSTRVQTQALVRLSEENALLKQILGARASERVSRAYDAVK